MNKENDKTPLNCLFSISPLVYRKVSRTGTIHPGIFLAFTRFTSRRGVTKEVINDRGTNFAGRCNRRVKELTSQPVSRQKLERLGVTWRFNPPPSVLHIGKSPRSDGEAAKKATYAVVRDRDVTDEKAITVFAEVESLLNSSPLTYQSSDPRDSVPLTP